MRALRNRWAALVQRRRLERIHRKLRAPERLTYMEFERACEILGFSPDRILQVEGEAAKMLKAEVTREQLAEFLDITHAGHGVDVKRLTMQDVQALCAVCAVNFTFASAVSFGTRPEIAAR
jgi:hypothetical protein